MASVYDEIERVRIFPNGPDKPPAQLLFDYTASKELYIQQEFDACYKFVKIYRDAKLKKARLAAQKVLFKERVEFARKSGFTPKPHEPLIWLRPDDKEKVLVNKW